jgi:hypothetical protein
VENYVVFRRDEVDKQWKKIFLRFFICGKLVENRHHFFGSSHKAQIYVKNKYIFLATLAFCLENTAIL